MSRTAIAVLAAALLAAGVAESATASCNPGRSNANGNWHDGWEAAVPTGACLTGNRANIYVASPYVAAADDTAWVMLANGVTLRYGQVGWYQDANGNRWNFTESNTVNGGFHQNFYSPSSLGSTPLYQVTFSSNTFHYYVNGANVGNDGNTGYTGCQADTEAEVTNSANQMPGGTVAHEYFQNNNDFRSDISQWGSFSGAWVDDNTTWYGNTRYSTTEDDVWDSACSS